MPFTTFQLLTRSLRHYWRWHVGLLLGVAVAAWVIVGSLLVGDAVKATLARQAKLRLGQIDEAVSTGEGFVSTRVATSLQGKLPAAKIAPVLFLKGTVSVPGGAQRANGVNLIGVEESFWKLATAPRPAPAGLAVNEALAALLHLQGGETLIARFEKPSLISRDAPLSGESDQTAVLNAPLAGIVTAEALGDFSLKAEQSAPLNLFVPLADLQQAADQAGQCNLLLAQSHSSPDTAPNSLLGALQSADSWTLADAGIELTALANGSTTRIASPRIFLPEALVKAAGGEASGVLTYLCNAATGAEQHYTAYPMISAVDARLGVVPPDLPANGMVINQWMAEQLQLKVGDAVKVNYFTVTRARQLAEQNADFVVHSILPMEHPAMNEEWTPNFPGVTEAANCRDWKPGIPMKTKGFITNADEAYWQKYKATPKAFIALETGQRLWQNRFGNLTSLRFAATPEVLEGKLKASLTLRELGFAFAEPQKLAQAAVDGSMDFGALFLSMSFFLIITALILASLLFLFNVEARAGQVGLLRAVGISGDRVRWLFIGESLLAAVLGAVLGATVAAFTTGWLLGRLEGDWRGAVGGLHFVREIHGTALLHGIGMTLAFTLGAVWWVSRRLTKCAPQRLLAGDGLQLAGATKLTKRRRTFHFWLGMACLLIAVGVARQATQLTRTTQPGAFFGAAILVLTGGILLCGDWLRGLEQRTTGVASPWALGLRNAVRRRGRSLAILGLLASGIFMVTALHAFHQDAAEDEGKGTGGFDFIGTSDLSIYEDLNTPEGRETYGLDAKLLEGTQLTAFRQREGEEASCLNLNQAQTPSVLGIDPARMVESAFQMKLWKGVAAGAKSWEALETTLDDGAIPALADQNSAMWALKKGLGEVVEMKDAQGQPLRLRLVAFVNGTILQGHLVIAEKAFLKHFPDTAGTRFFLVKSPHPAAIEHLTRQLQNRGLALRPARGRLGELQGVQNTYLQIFSALGGMALILSTAALALLIARNVLERQSEFALLQATGFRAAQLRQILLGEHLPLFLMALVLGIGAAILAVWPQITEGGRSLPVGLLAVVLSGLTMGGIAFCLLAAHLALRRPLLASLRQE